VPTVGNRRSTTELSIVGSVLLQYVLHRLGSLVTILRGRHRPLISARDFLLKSVGNSFFSFALPKLVLEGFTEAKRGLLYSLLL
jgi:hypothetical protein